MKTYLLIPGLLALTTLLASCKKDDVETDKPTVFSLNSVKVNGTNDGFEYANLGPSPVVTLAFSAKIDPASVPAGVQWRSAAGAEVPYKVSYKDENRELTVQPEAPLSGLTSYTLQLSTDLKSKAGGSFQVPITVKLRTGLDSTNKFPVISDDSLLTLVQRQTFRYFWEFGHPVSGLARERNTSGDVVTSGGSGFGIMAIPVAVSRNFISRSQGLERTQKIVTFLSTKAQRYHGAFPHWLNGATGATVPFSAKDMVLTWSKPLS